MKIGFEIHQQLDTSKLFCPSPSILREGDPELNINRRLRPSQSELGDVDEAAMKEFLKGKSYNYKVYSDTICLVELDEEPPRGPNAEAVESALIMALLFNADIVDEIHFMRKVVIDGSNTSGFQRTAIIAFDGFLETGSGRIGIPTICLEEEAARKVSEDGLTTTYNLDRLGIPLVEITTSPDITSPKQAREVALKIGELLRATGRVKRGIGTIRQDVNISIEGGARVEIKGVQDLNTIPGLIEKEVERQKKLIDIKKELKKRGVGEGDIKSEMHDVSDVFEKTESKIIREQLKKGKVLALKLPGFSGLLGGGVLGREIANHVKTHTGVRGIFHSDELPSYGISKSEVKAVNKLLKIGGSEAFVIVAEKEKRARSALTAVVGRARLALKGPLEETRMAKDTSTDYMRPLPGAARMYPETDILPYVVSAKLLERLKKDLPESYEERAARLSKDYGIGKEQARQLVRKPPEVVASFEEVASGLKNWTPAGAASVFLDNDKFVASGEIDLNSLKTVILAFDIGTVSKEAIPEIIEDLRGGKTVEDAIKDRSGRDINLEDIVDKIIAEKSEFIKEKGAFAQKPLMGLVMKEAKGRVDGRVVSEILKKKIDEFLSR